MAGSEYSNINKEIIIEVLEKLYQAKKVFPYTALAFVLKPNELLDFLDLFGGTTIEVPTKEEFSRVVAACLVEAIGDYDEAKAINPEILSGLSKLRYEKIVEELKNAK